MGIRAGELNCMAITVTDYEWKGCLAASGASPLALFSLMNGT